MKYFIKSIIVVEGKEDVSYLSSFIDALYVETKGYNASKNDIDFLINASKIEKIIILTDSDEAGEKIRNELSKHILDAIHLSVSKDKCNKNGKHGVAECEKEEIVKILSPYFVKDNHNTELSLDDLIQIGIDNKEKRRFVCEQLSLGLCNTKTLIKRVNYLGINKEQLREALNQYGNKQK